MVTALFNCQQESVGSKKMIVEIPDTTGHTPDIRPYLRSFSDELNLQRLEHGVDSFEMRFNTRIGVLKCGFGQLLVIKKKDNEWECYEYQYLIHYPPFESSQDWLEFSIDTIFVYKRVPVSGWRKLLDALEQENIYNLPDQADISSWDSLGVTIADGTSYSVEFANRERYKYYSYNTPQDLLGISKECKNMSNIIQILDRRSV